MANNFKCHHCANPCPQDCWVKVVTRNRNVTETETLYQKETPEPREAPRIALKRAPAVRGDSPRSSDSARGDSSRNSSQGVNFPEMWSVRLVPKVDQRLHRVPLAEVQNDQARKQLISSLTRLLLNHPEKKKLMDELSINNDDSYKPMSDHVKQIIKDQGDVEAYDLCQFSHKVQCQHCSKYMSSDNVYCEFGNAFAQAFKNQQIQNQVSRRTELHYGTPASFSFHYREGYGTRTPIWNL